MTLRPTTIRFAPDAMALVQRAADELGTSVAQFVREAAIVRAAIVLNHEGTQRVRQELQALPSTPEIQRLARRDE